MVIGLYLRLCLASWEQGQSHCSSQCSFLHTVFKQALGMPFIGKSTGLVTRVFSDEQGTGQTLRNSESNLVGCGSDNCELLFWDSTHRACRELFLSSPEEEWEWLFP